MKITLIGDSIFDNKTYVGNGKSVIEHLQEIKPKEWEANLRAIDRAVTAEVLSQLSKVPKDTTHLFLSIGGNDALGEGGMLNKKVRLSAEVFNNISDTAFNFEVNYSLMLNSILAFNLPTPVCTIYYPMFEDELMQKLSVAALASFNDVIIRQACMYKLPLIDLRLLCNEKSDYANPIEPSASGGKKIAGVITDIAGGMHNFDEKKTSIYF